DGPAAPAPVVRHWRAESHVEPAWATVAVAVEVRRGAEGRRAAGAAARAVPAGARGTDRHGVGADDRRQVGDGVGARAAAAASRRARRVVALRTAATTAAADALDEDRERARA